MNFSLIFQMLHRRFSDVKANTILKWYICWIMVAYALFCINVIQHDLVKDVWDLTIDPIFQAISLVSSTGMTEPNFAEWGSLSEVVMVILIFTGACAGSTSGGAKLDRIVVLFKFLRNEFYKMMHPTAVTTVRINGKGTSYVLVQKTLAFLFMYTIVIIVGGIILNLLGLNLHDAFFYALSSVSNAGLGTEVSIVTRHYSEISDIAKFLMSLLMLIGRLELYTVLLIFTPMFWKH